MAVRDRTKADYWGRMIRRQGGSGLSVRAWCGRQDVSEALFFWWRRRLAQNGEAACRLARSGTAAEEPGQRDIAKPQFVPVRIAAEAPSPANEQPCCIEILLRGDRRVRLFGAVDRKALADVLAVLQSGDADGVGGTNHVIDAEAGAC